MSPDHISEIDGAFVYQQGFRQFSYFIETIGTVSIDEVSLDGNVLTAIYSYRLGSETRNVVSRLVRDKDDIYKGTCTTTVGKHVLFAVNTWLIFKSDGTGQGNWSWSGAPSKTDPIVRISKS